MVKRFIEHIFQVLLFVSELKEYNKDSFWEPFNPSTVEAVTKIISWLQDN